MLKYKNIFRWIGVAFLGIMTIGAIGAGAYLSAISFFLVCTIIMPLKIFNNFFKKMKLRKTVTICLVVGLLLVGFAMFPANKPIANEKVSVYNSTIDDSSNGEIANDDKSTSSMPSTNSNDTLNNEVSNKTENSDSKTETPNQSQTPSEDNHQNNSDIVYITNTGKKYHSYKSCSGLSRAKAIIETTLSNAKKSGLTACSKCH